MEIGTIVVDFSIFPDFDLNYLMIGDRSKWFAAENLPATIEITPPGAISPIIETFQKHKINSFNSVNLGMACLAECEEQTYTPLPDGIWTIAVKSGFTGIEKTRYFLKTDQTRLLIDNIRIKSGLEYDMHDKQFRRDLDDIEFLISTAMAHTRRGDFFKADRDFNQAVDIINKYVDCKNCI